MRINRRTFLKTAAAASAASPLGFVAPLTQAADSTSDSTKGLVTDFVHVTPDNKIVVVVKHVEAGQGPTTGLATLVAEEMNADWQQIEVVFAPADNAIYANLFFGIQGTGGSTAMANSFVQYRKAGAQALMRLKTAAAEKWGVSLVDVQAENGLLSAANNKATYGEMANAAAAVLPSATEPMLKKPQDFKHIGKENRPRKDMNGKTNGSAQYAMDVHPKNLLYAVVARSPKFGGVLLSFDDSAAKKVASYAGAKAIPSGVAVYANTLWGAIKARRLLKTKWDFAAAETRSSEQMMDDYQQALEKPGLVFHNSGDADAALAASHKTVEADFTFPFLAHAPMEPLNCVIEKRGDNITVWDGCQMPGLVQGAVAAVFGLMPQQVNIKSVLAGGTFGRRATPTNDYQVEAAHALKESPDISRPLKLLWTREDDIQGGFYRPMFAHRARAGIDKNGNISGWHHRIAGNSIALGTPFEAMMIKDGVDNSSVEGLDDMPYKIGAMHGDVRNMESAVPVLWWRSVGHTHTAFAKEVMIDMLAEAAGEDAVAFRLRHLLGDKAKRQAAVLRAAAKAAGWGRAAAGRFQGVAVHRSFNSYVAEVVEISLTKGNGNEGKVKVEKVTCAVDCGIAINPDMVRAQMESGIGYGLGAAMRNHITLAAGGEVQQSNFPNYEPLRIGDMPDINTVIVPSLEAPTGVGEPGTPPVAPALSAAIYAATGKRITKLPFVAHGVEFA